MAVRSVVVNDRFTLRNSISFAVVLEVILSADSTTTRLEHLPCLHVSRIVGRGFSPRTQIANLRLRLLQLGALVFHLKQLHL